ncbi:F-box only protein 40 [Dissostichus eleginoides]|uniref:F-box only protein 40 n=1 Tax=Dissostichus eleginoides TaxID=100907 RepID=A0AAD9BGC5_DISEL|nr:F-box only protein 40 [Dissostichus eleginoides]
MSDRARASRVRQHVHCDSCYSRRCRARVEVSVCCAVIPCRLLCGAVFHLCKEEDHLLLCPNVRVPCLNAGFGCPLQMPRSSQAAHLQVCPASLVCCSMEWNRWPANDAHSYPNTELHENLIREREQGGCLDLAMALRDQDLLFHSMKMKNLFPELTQSVDEPFHALVMNNNGEIKYENEDEVELTQEERLWTLDSTVDTDLLENYNAWERMFSMEMGGCREAGKAAKDQSRSAGRGTGLGTLTEEDTEDNCGGAAASDMCTQGSSACIASNSSSSLAGKLKQKEFVYGYVEPMKIITVRTFKTPSSFSAKHSRIRNPGFYKREKKAVDTSDLGVTLQEMPVWEEVQASLLCSLEKEQRGHLIAESRCMDGLLEDEGTQTYNFLWRVSPAGTTRPAPPSPSSAHTFKRREYGKHYKNVHSDIQMCVNGWFEQRCPLSYLGCTYSQKRFQPSTHEATVSYNEDIGCYSLNPTTPSSLGDTSTFLDSLSLSQLALVSQLMRQVSSSLLQERGMVTLRWERKTYSHGGAKWRVTETVWQFSTLFSPVDSWCFQNVPPMSEHLKVCPCYERESRTEKIHLPRVKEEVQTKTGCKGPSLITLLQKTMMT